MQVKDNKWPELTGLAALILLLGSFPDIVHQEKRGSLYISP